MQNKNQIAKVVELLKKSDNLLFITGAGISADSGLPTYRGKGGLYNDAVTDEGISVETVMAGEMIEARPEITWKYIAKLEKRCRDATFNRAHEIIAEMEKHFERVWVLTQNIDGFHQLAGSKNVIDIHGNIHKLMCMRCQWRTKIGDFSELQDLPPKCPLCNAIVRPDVVFFGEFLAEDKINILSKELDRGFDIYFSVGTTSIFPYIRQPMLIAQHLGRPTIEINPANTEISELVDIKISLGAAEALDEIWQEFQKSLL